MTRIEPKIWQPVSADKQYVFAGCRLKALGAMLLTAERSTDWNFF